MSNKITAVLNGIIEQFKTGDIPQAIAYAKFPIPNIPSANWSMLNQLLMRISPTADARGFKQWQAVNRSVKKGSKAIYILVPMFKKKQVEEEEVENVLLGFTVSAVFRVEDTEGEPLAYEQIVLPDLPLLDKARNWEIEVKAIPGNTSYYGCYLPEYGEIHLASPGERTFFHELAHVAHEKVLGSLQSGQHPAQEIVAELSAQALCRIVGKTFDEQTGNSYRYIESYAQRLNLTAHQACFKLLAEVEKVLNLILGDRSHD